MHTSPHQTVIFSLNLKKMWSINILMFSDFSHLHKSCLPLAYTTKSKPLVSPKR